MQQNFFVAQTYYLKFYCNTSHKLLQWLQCYCDDFFVVINIFCCSGRCCVQIPFFQFNKIDNIFCIWKPTDFKCKSWLDSSLSTGEFKLAIMEIRARISSVALITKVSSVFWYNNIFAIAINNLLLQISCSNRLLFHEFYYNRL